MSRIAVLALLLLATQASADVYRCADADGKLTFTDKRCPGAEEISVPPASTYAPPRLGSAIGSGSGRDEPAAGYRLRLTRPAPEETIRTSQGLVGLKLELDPPLHQGHTIAVLLDGRPLPDTHTSTDITLKDVTRGQHTVQVQVIDDAGTIARSSDSVRFYLRWDVIPTPQQAPRAPGAGGAQRAPRGQ